MENSKLPWQSAWSEGASAWQGKLALVLLLAGSDGADCCAKNFERTLFRDDKVLKFARKNFAPYRLERMEGPGLKFYDKFKLNVKKPAVLVLDTDGDPLFAVQKCINPGDCYKGLAAAVTRAAQKTALTVKAQASFEKAETLIGEKKYGEAVDALQKIPAAKIARPLREKVERKLKALEAYAHRRLASAAKYEEKKNFERAREIYSDVSENFARFKKAKSEALAGLRRVRQAEADGGSASGG
jgi:hypothetical protein